MIAEHGIWIGSLWAITAIVGALGIPLSRVLFNGSSDGGYAFSKILSWFAIGYIAFLIATIGVAPLALPAIVLALLVWAAVNAFVFWRMRGRMTFLPRISQVAVAELIFIAVCTGIVVVKGFHPEVYQIERFMDFGFIETLRNSSNLPLTDLWLAGETLNYYYMSHFIGFVILTLTGIPSVPGFFLLIGFIAGTLAVAVARFAIDVAIYISGKKEELSRMTKTLVAGVSVFVALFSGTWYMIPWIVRSIKHFFGMGAVPNFFYPEPTRAIAGTITEMPIFSFLVADIHAHVWGMLTALLVLAIAFSLWRDTSAKLDLKNQYFLPMAFALGMAYMVNSWDAVSLGALAVFFVVVKYRREPVVRVVIAAALLGGLAYAVALPWSLTNHLPIEGVGLVHAWSPFLQWLSFWGSIVIIVVVFALRTFWVRRKLREHTDELLFIGVIFIASLFFLLVVEIFFMKDILIKGEWYRANTVFKVSTQVWIWIAVCAGPVYLWLYRSFASRVARIITGVFLVVYVGIGAVYPIIAVRQAFTGSNTFFGIDHGLDWWENKYPNDYAAYQYLKGVRDALPHGERLKRIVEAEGESYTDVSRFSVFLGWPTIVGWPVHEWTWRGSYDVVGKRRDEVREIYTGTNVARAHELLKQYEIEYLILGAVERDRYVGTLQENKLRSLGPIVFEKGNALVIKVR